MRRLGLASAAEQDLANISAWIAHDNPHAAEKVLRAIVAAARRLPNFPEMGRAGRWPETREFPVPGLPYLLVYAVTADAVTIIAVFHESRDLARAWAERQQGAKPS